MDCKLLGDREHQSVNCLTVVLENDPMSWCARLGGCSRWEIVAKHTGEFLYDFVMIPLCYLRVDERLPFGIVDRVHYLDGGSVGFQLSGRRVSGLATSWGTTPLL